MERLTERVNELLQIEEKNDIFTLTTAERADFQRTVIERIEEYDTKCEELAKYQQLEEDGLLLRLPCKVGDTVYVLVEMNEHGVYQHIKPDVVKSIYLSSRNEWKMEFTYIWHDTELSDIGETVFLTQAEAEQALKRLESET